MKLLGLKACKNKEEFWEELEGNHEEGVLEQLENAFIAHNDGEEDHLYDVKNQSLELSLHVSNFSTDLYQKYFEWMTCHIIDSPGRILDLGCDNGIATCFFAMLFPHSEVIGIDINENGLYCAKELADKLKLSNVTFLKINFKKICEHFSSFSFDYIVSLRSFHEMIGEFPENPDEPHQDYRLNHVQALLRDENSQFISCERLLGFDSIQVWAKLLEEAKLFINFHDSCFIRFHEIGQEQRMPVLVTSRQKSDVVLSEGVSML